MLCVASFNQFHAMKFVFEEVINSNKIIIVSGGLRRALIFQPITLSLKGEWRGSRGRAKILTLA